ncbi:MAG: hypothetical protein KGQ49_05395, partial [Verrucomicrobia bacterium]|nr:hypothetical protein [Verrucomicrobiota bacterium]
MKKIIFCISLLILFSVLFSTQLIGFGVKRMVKAKTDCELAYRSCQWEQGHLVFSDVVLFDPSLQVHMEKVSFRLDVSSFPKKLKGHLTIDAPHIAMIKNRAIPQLGAGWFDLSVSVHNGRMFWGGPVHFALGHNAEQSQLSMHWDNGSVQLTCAKEKVDAVLDRFQVALLKAWIPHIDVREGTVSGRMALDREGNLLSGHLKLTDASLAFSNCNADGVQGAFSYNQGLGAKWDCQGIGKANGELFPFFSTGRAFFKTFWMESDMRFDESHCKISGDDKRVSLECHAVTASEASWMQAAACFLLPECAAIAMTHGILSGKASWSGDTWSAQFTADQLTLTHGDISLSCQSLIADLRQEGGSFILSDKDYELKLAGMWDDWNAEARIHQAELLLNGGWDGDKVVFEIEKGKMAELQFQGKGDIDSHFNVSLLVDGTWTFLQQNIPFYGPIHCQEGKIWDVDVRGKRKTWDFCRFHFTYDGTEILYLPSSHFLGKALTAHPCALNEIDLSVQLPWNNLLAAGPLLTLWNMDIKTLPDIGNTELHFQYKQGQIDLTAQGDLPFSFHAHHALDEWAFEWTSD